MNTLAQDIDRLDAVSRALQDVHRKVLETEAPPIPGRTAASLLDRLINDPEWAWLRALSRLIADIDARLADDEALTPADAAAAAARALVFGVGERLDEDFLARYRPLLQQSPALASAHGELKRRLDEVAPVPAGATRH
jgi:hypothetical protein